MRATMACQLLLRIFVVGCLVMRLLCVRGWCQYLVLSRDTKPPLLLSARQLVAWLYWLAARCLLHTLMHFAGQS